MMETPVADEYCKLGEGMSVTSAISEITKLKVTEPIIIADDRTFRGRSRSTTCLRRDPMTASDVSGYQPYFDKA